MFPLFTARCLHVRHDVRDPSGGSGNCGRECCPVILPKWRLPRHLGIFYMPQIYMEPTALLPLRRKACWGFFLPLKIRRLRPGLNPRTWVLKASTLPLDTILDINLIWHEMILRITEHWLQVLHLSFLHHRKLWKIWTIFHGCVAVRKLPTLRQ